jgi:YHS domain-containing protein
MSRADNPPKAPICDVCRKPIATEGNQIISAPVREGREYWLCSLWCAFLFETDSERYTRNDAP